MNSALILLLQSLFVITNVAPGTVDTQPPTITNVTYGASTPVDGAQLAKSTRFEFRVTASDNLSVAYATLELLKNLTDADGELIQFKRAYLGPLPPTFVLTWDEALQPGTYYVRIRVYDLLQNKAERVFSVKK